MRRKGGVRVALTARIPDSTPGSCGACDRLSSTMPSLNFLVLRLLLPVLVAVMVWELVSDDWREHADLVIGILSARYNFGQREAIRRTWVNESANRPEFKTKSLFVVGDEDCDVPVEDRISPFGCERLILNTSLVSQPNLLLFRVTGATQSESCAPFAGISFQVSFFLHPNRLLSPFVDAFISRIR